MEPNNTNDQNEIAATLRAMFPSRHSPGPVPRTDWGTSAVAFLTSHFGQNWTGEDALRLLLEAVREQQAHPSQAIRDLVCHTVLPTIVRISLKDSPATQELVLCLLGALLQ